MKINKELMLASVFITSILLSMNFASADYYYMHDDNDFIPSSGYYDFAKSFQTKMFYPKTYYKHYQPRIYVADYGIDQVFRQKSLFTEARYYSRLPDFLIIN